MGIWWKILPNKVISDIDFIDGAVVQYYISVVKILL